MASLRAAFRMSCREFVPFRCEFVEPLVRNVLNLALHRIGDISPFDTIAVHPSDAPWYLNPSYNKPVTVKFGGQSFKSNPSAELEPVFAGSSSSNVQKQATASVLSNVAGGISF